MVVVWWCVRWRGVESGERRDSTRTRQCDRLLLPASKRPWRAGRPCVRARARGASSADHAKDPPVQPARGRLLSL